MQNINSTGIKAGIRHAYAYGHANKKPEGDFKNKLETAKSEIEQTPAVNVIPTFDSSTGIIMPF